MQFRPSPDTRHTTGRICRRRRLLFRDPLISNYTVARRCILSDMPKAPRFLVLSCLATALGAQEQLPTALNLLNARLDIQSAAVTLRTERNLSKASDAVKAEVDRLTGE